MRIEGPASLHEVRRTFSFHDGGPPRGAAVAAREGGGGTSARAKEKARSSPSKGITCARFAAPVWWWCAHALQVQMLRCKR